VTPFASLTGVQTAEIEDSPEGPMLVLNLSPDETERSAALYGAMDLLKAQGRVVRAIAQRQQNLESIFLKLTTSSI